ncbi:MAG: hypothetical protein M3460_25765 [Actinomycetota bacterium]|nr:hypothetical protein [Actinomycetota bacterium]
MTIPGGYRFTVPFDDVFPQGCYVMSVERASDYNNGKPRPAVDPTSNKPVWAIQVTDPSAKGKNTSQVVKMTADVQPVPPEAIPDTPFRPAIFEEMSAVPYVRDGWVSYTLWAKEMRSALSATGGRTANPSRTSGASPEAGKAAA